MRREGERVKIARESEREREKDLNKKSTSFDPNPVSLLAFIDTKHSHERLSSL